MTVYRLRDDIGLDPSLCGDFCVREPPPVPFPTVLHWWVERHLVRLVDSRPKEIPESP